MKVFITHGHNEVAKLKIKDYLLTRLSHEPVILGEQPGRQGLTIIEALEKFSEGCEFAVILLTTDDLTKDGGQRARQNVIHEVGFFQGRLGRSKVVLIVEKGVEIPSNLLGLFYIQYERDIKEVFADLQVIFEARDASASAKTLDKEDSLAGKVINLIDNFSSGNQLSKDLERIFVDLTTRTEHMSDKAAMNRILSRLEEKVGEGEQYVSENPKPRFIDVDDSENPIGANIGNALISSVHANAKEKHRILKELKEDLFVLRDSGKSLEEIILHMKHVLRLSEG